MSSLFSPDSKLMKVLSTLADLLILNVMYCVSCLGVITIGAANTALYSAIFKLNTERECSSWKDYWQAFKANFKQATLIWLIISGLFVVAAVDIYAGNAYGGVFMVLRPFFWIILVSAGLCYSTVFSILSRYDNTVLATIKNSLLVSVANLPKSLALTALHALPIAVFLWDIATFLKWSALLVVLYPAALAYVGRLLFEKVYLKLMDTQCEQKPKSEM